MDFNKARVVSYSKMNIDDKELNLLDQKNDCYLIESWTFTNYPKNKGDGVHYDKVPLRGAKLAKRWARKVYSRL